ncbi:hypothetical protein [Methylocucumis oryzae]|uniref:Uncharacterized protein n=1 Tax=Methylocucumis oryzae TaxID=1632867 RepID=A0A0F3IFY2_9GAMM|nr:hypothetical protein [Methylocucumis oryzae]KJV05463.1 hypothetical protein VZ94_18015 [Methylocucumis oryzae]
MKIHSSSLAYSPARLETNQQANNARAKPELSNDATAATPGSTTQVNATTSINKQALEKIQQNHDAQRLLITTTQDNAYNAADKRTQHALNAYQQNLSQATQTHQTPTTGGVDFYA